MLIRSLALLAALVASLGAQSPKGQPRIVEKSPKEKADRLERLVRDNCNAPVPSPVITLGTKDASGRQSIPVSNWSSIPTGLFRRAPELPPCGENASSSRTWVDVVNADTNQVLYGFCALGSNQDLKDLWFMPPTPNGRVCIVLKDRACGKQYRSNVLVYGECAVVPPNPVITLGAKDADGRITLPVSNWSDFPNPLFRKAPELPPCGSNTASSRTWVDIYNAATDTRVYGFCAFSSNADLRNIWFKPSTATGKVYIVIEDRACGRKLRSNTIAY